MAQVKGGERATAAMFKKRQRVVQAVAALQKDGKTTYGLSAPDPIGLINLDQGLEGVIEGFIEAGKEIHVCDVTSYQGETKQVGWEAAWNKVAAFFKACLTNKDIRTIVMDTETEAWELIRLASFGKLDHIKSHHYGPVNDEYRHLINGIYSTDKNLILLRKLKDEYVDEKRTGNKEMAGFKDIPYMVQMNCYLYRKTDRNKPANLKVIDKGEGEFILRVIDCRLNAKLAGLELEGETASFPYLACEVFPDSSPMDWM